MRLVLLLIALISSLLASSAEATKFADNTVGACANNTYRITQRDCAGVGTGHQSYNTISSLTAAMSASETAYIRSGTFSYSSTATIPASAILSGCPASVCGTQEIPVLMSTTFPVAFSNSSKLSSVKIRMCNQSGTDAGVSFFNTTLGILEDFEIDGCAASVGANGVGNGILMTHSTPSTVTGHIIRRGYIHDIAGSDASGFRWHGSYVNTKGNTIENVIFARVCNYSIHSYNGGGNTDDNIFRFNTVVDDGQVASHPSCAPPNQNTAGILAYGDNAQIYGNIGYNGGDKCIEVHGANSVVYNNTCYNHGPFSNYGIWISPSATNAIVKNNLVIGNSNTIQDEGAGTVQTNNLTTGSAASHFVNASAGNFHLQVGSTAIDAGTSLGSTYERDFDNGIRPFGAAWDIGAFEFGASSTVPNPVILKLSAAGMKIGGGVSVKTGTEP